MMLNNNALNVSVIVRLLVPRRTQWPFVVKNLQFVSITSVEPMATETVEPKQGL